VGRPRRPGRDDRVALRRRVHRQDHQGERRPGAEGARRTARRLPRRPWPAPRTRPRPPPPARPPDPQAYLALKKDAEKEGKNVDVKVGVLDGQVLDMAGVEALKNLPTKEELYTKIAVGVKAVPTKVALGIKAVPTKLARSISLVAELDEDKTKTVADVVKSE